MHPTIMCRSNRRPLVALVLAASLAVTALVAWLLWPRTAIIPENFARLREGMTLAEVDAILGGLPRDESTGALMAILDEEIADDGARDRMEENRVSQFYRGEWGGQRDPERTRLWVSDRLMIRVDHDDTGRLTRTQALPVRCVHVSLLTQMRDWFGR